MKYIITSICLFCVAEFCFPNNSISGFIFDKDTGEPLIGATIYTDVSNNATFSNNSGYFYLNVPRNDTAKVIISYLGYHQEKKPLQKVINKQHSYFLVKDKYSIDEITVIGNVSRPKMAGISTLSVDQIKNLPSLSGDADILKAFQLLPGIQGGNEGTVGLIVRGGTNDQNLYLVDDVPLYYVNHLGGFVSVFDASAVKSATLYKGFFPAAFGGRLSSIMDVRLKEGNLYEPKKELTIGTIVSKFFIETPVKEEKTTLMLSARLCNLGLLTAFQKDGSYFFYDLNSKLTHRFDENNKLYFTFYSGSDFYITKYDEDLSGDKSKYKANYTFGNNMANLRWFHVFNSYYSSNLILSYTKFHNTNNRHYMQ